MESNLVIKVKYGDTLRRFSACINENRQLDLDMAGLRAKIFDLFSFTSDAELALTYIDEDGDVITLADDDDLHDVTRQNLKFLRINVQLNIADFSKSSARSSGTSTPLRSSQVQHPLQNINTCASEFLKSLPEPLLDAISKLSLDLASKALSTNPLLTDLVDHLSKVRQSFLDASSQTSVASGTNRQGGSSEGLVAPLVPTMQNPSTDGGLRYIFSQSASANLVCKGGQETGAGNVVSGVKTQVIPESVTVDLNLESTSESDLSGSTGVKSSPALSNVVAGDDKNDKIRVNDHSKKGVSFPVLDDPKRNAQYYHTNASAKNLSNECPFSGVSIANDPVVPPYSQPGTFNWCHMPFSGMSGIFHRGVQCDGCGIHPITGPRFKSKVKEDYDLCGICFSKMGNEADYIRMDRPVSYRHPRCIKSIGAGGPALPNIWRSHGMKFGRPKLDSRFVLDVNILDGTVMAPSTPFTKIWRMRNSGNLPWPNCSKLVWIGGDKFSDAVSVDIETPMEGVPIDGELDIAVDFTAPELPGRYISYWRMASPSGTKFGQRVWVLIQVDESLKDSICGSLQGLNLNLPPASCGLRDFMDMDSGSAVDVTMPITPMVDQQSNKEQVPAYGINNHLLVVDDVSVSSPIQAPAFAPPEALLAALTQKAPSSLPLESPTASVSAQTPLASVSVLPSSAHAPPKYPSPSSEAYPIIAQGVPTPESSTPVSVDDFLLAGSTQPPTTLPEVMPSSSQDSVESSVLEQTLLKELEAMGFKQVDLNKEVLRLNEYDLEKSIEDLCGVAEWDPILEELQEMGFCDAETNKKLLKKNDGSIKRVVMDLLTG
ncbi:hypothetical protein SLA2020_030190 [Shorea laevis]